MRVTRRTSWRRCAPRGSRRPTTTRAARSPRTSASLRGGAVHSARGVPRPRRVSILPDRRGRRTDRVLVEHREEEIASPTRLEDGRCRVGEYRTRTAEGRSRAQKRGQHMGRKPKLTEAQQDEARRRRAEGATLAELARSYGVGKSTISRHTA
jgi:hypothetical protein